MSQTPLTQSTPYTLFYVPDSANLVVRIALEELGASFAALLVEGAGAASRDAAFLALNPQGLVPVLVDSHQDEPLFETAAILLHLSEQHKALQPAYARSRGRYLKWLFFLSNTLHADLRGLFYSDRYVADVAAIPALRRGLGARVVRHFTLLDAEMARHGGPWLLGETLTTCDIYLAVCARWAQLYPRGDGLASDVFANLPHVHHMLKTLEQRPAVLRACEQEGIAGRAFTVPQYPLR
ncbi:MAG TPA: glutathione S-transferase family protein [Burkholderiaceae bacterium]|jgi:glutathione S-transferase|nr:glutathione S-transferase family protein [Burkholderiaceae bacterium]HPH13170.1 glutathione S-transferase family protein [Burkholderiaceae bacterium]